MDESERLSLNEQHIWIDSLLELRTYLANDTRIRGSNEPSASVVSRLGSGRDDASTTTTILDWGDGCLMRCSQPAPKLKA